MEKRLQYLGVMLWVQGLWDDFLQFFNSFLSLSSSGNDDQVCFFSS